MTEIKPEFQQTETASPSGQNVESGIVRFIKSQTPEEHTRRIMERYDRVSAILPGKAQEVAQKVRPVLEKTAKVSGYVTTAGEVAVAAAAVAGAGYLSYKGGSSALETEAGQAAKELLKNTGAKVAEQAKKATRKPITASPVAEATTRTQKASNTVETVWTKRSASTMSAKEAADKLAAVAAGQTGTVANLPPITKATETVAADVIKKKPGVAKRVVGWFTKQFSSAPQEVFTTVKQGAQKEAAKGLTQLVVDQGSKAVKKSFGGGNSNQPPTTDGHDGIAHEIGEVATGVALGVVGTWLADRLSSHQISESAQTYLQREDELIKSLASRLELNNREKFPNMNAVHKFLFDESNILRMAKPYNATEFQAYPAIADLVSDEQGTRRIRFLNEKGTDSLEGLRFALQFSKEKAPQNAKSGKTYDLPFPCVSEPESFERIEEFSHIHDEAKKAGLWGVIQIVVTERQMESLQSLIKTADERQASQLSSVQS